MKRLLYILFLFLTSLVNGQAWPADSFSVAFTQDFEDNTIGLYSSNLSEWMADWDEPSERMYFNGRETTGIVQKGSTKGMIIYYDEGTVNGEDQGCDFEAYNVIGWDNDSIEMYLSWDVMWKPGFDFVLSGKVAGSLNGSERWYHVGAPTYYEGFKVKVSWFKAGWNGRGYPSIYMYHHDQPGASGDVRHFFEPDNPSNTYYFDTSEETWVNITLRVVVNSNNTPPANGNNDGLVEGYINGKLAAQWDGLRLRNVDSIGVNNIRIYSQFGGVGSQFETTRDEWLITDNYYMWTYDWGVTGVPRHRELSDTGRVLHIPESWTNATLSYGDTLSPVVSGISSQSINAGESFSTISLDNHVTSTVYDDDQMVWSTSGDSEISVDITSRVATLTYSGSSISENITFTATDPVDSTGSQTATFTVNDTTSGGDVLGQKILVNCHNNNLSTIPETVIEGNYWNHFHGGTDNDSTSLHTLYNTSGENSGFYLEITSSGMNDGDNGYVGTNYPDTCEYTHWRADNPGTFKTMDIYGFTIGEEYNIKTFNSSTGNNGNTEITIWDTLKVVDAYQNTDTLEWGGIAPDTITELKLEAGGGFGYLNLFEINEFGEDTTAVSNDTITVSDTIQAELACDLDSLVCIEYNEDTTIIRVGCLTEGRWFKLCNVDFGALGWDSVGFRTSATGTGRYIKMKLDSLTADSVAYTEVDSTTTYDDYETNTTNLLENITGIHDVYIEATYWMTVDYLVFYAYGVLTKLKFGYKIVIGDNKYHIEMEQ